jgi:hypothetical protein
MRVVRWHLWLEMRIGEYSELQAGGSSCRLYIHDWWCCQAHHNGCGTGRTQLATCGSRAVNSGQGARQVYHYDLGNSAEVLWRRNQCLWELQAMMEPQRNPCALSSCQRVSMHSYVGTVPSIWVLA